MVYITNTLCATCDNLIFTTDYMCKLGLNNRRDGYLCRKIIKKCEDYSERKLKVK